MVEGRPIPKDIVPTLGISLRLWSDRVGVRVEEQSNKFFKGMAYLARDHDNAKIVRQAFNARVASVLDLHRRANEADPTLDDAFKQRLAGAPVLHLVFSNDTEVPAAPFDSKKKSNTYLAHVVKACKDGNWQGVIKVDLSDPNIESSDMPEEYSSFKYFDNVLKKLKQGDWKKSVVVIIDGYGKQATDLGFAMDDKWYNDGYTTFFVRSTMEQGRLDATSSRGSLWVGKTPSFAPKPNPDAEDPNAGEEYPPYDPAKVALFANGLDTVIRRTQTGDKVCLQAPNNFGKTTALSVLAEMLKSAGNKKLRVCYIAVDGTLRDMIEGEPVTAEAVGDGETIIVDEAGREEMPENTAKEILSQLADSGNHIVRIYPGNVTPPNNFEVISLG